MALIPAGVAVREWRGSQAVGQDREADGQVDRVLDKPLVRQPGLLDDDDREDDGCQAPGSEPPTKPTV